MMSDVIDTSYCAVPCSSVLSEVVDVHYQHNKEVVFKGLTFLNRERSVYFNTCLLMHNALQHFMQNYFEHI